MQNTAGYLPKPWKTKNRYYGFTKRNEINAICKKLEKTLDKQGVIHIFNICSACSKKSLAINKQAEYYVIDWQDIIVLQKRSDIDAVHVWRFYWIPLVNKMNDLPLGGEGLYCQKTDI